MVEAAFSAKAACGDNAVSKGRPADFPDSDAAASDGQQSKYITE